MKNQENFIRGKIAVEIISEMLREARYYVYRFGYENTLASLAQRVGIQMEKGTISANKIRSMPDLVVMNKKSEVSFLEVKSRSSREPDNNLRERIGEAAKYWPEARILIIYSSEPHFMISSFPAFARTGKLYLLEQDKFFRVNKKITEHYTELIKKYLCV